MTLGRYHLSGWYVALVGVWLVVGVPAVFLVGLGMFGIAAFAIWLTLNAVLFAPVMLAPYGVRRRAAEKQA